MGNRAPFRGGLVILVGMQFSMIAVLSFACFGASVASAQEEVLTVERPGDGRLVCGLGKEFHQGRRAALLADLKAEHETGMVLLRGLPTVRDYGRFTQDKIVWYLTGIESPGVHVLMDVASGEEILFLPPRNSGSEAWNGELWDTEDDWVPGLTGFSKVRSSRDLMDTLEEWLGKHKNVWISKRPWIGVRCATDSATPFGYAQKRDKLDGRPTREKALEERLEEMAPKAKVRNFAPILDQLRLRKQPAEVAALRRSSRAGAVAMMEAMRSTRPGLGEWELAGLLKWEFTRQGGFDTAYEPIVGSGANSCVLHYMSSTRTMQDGEILLIDAGPELDHFTTDITRTWPVNGRFSERQAEIYDAVLKGQQAGIDVVEPGMTMKDVNDKCVQVMLDEGFSKEFILHGTCHWVGMEVHDVGGYGTTLEPGMVFTIEPGLYEKSTGIGVRIEDVVVVTEDGCEVITDFVPRDRAAIEALVQEQGVLDWRDQAGADPGSAAR